MPDVEEGVGGVVGGGGEEHAVGFEAFDAVDVLAGDLRGVSVCPGHEVELGS